MSKTAIFHIEGGLGKHVAATAVAKTIAKSYPDRELIVVCAYPEIFINLDFVSRVYKHGNTPYFYNDFIKNKDFLLFKHEPYFTTEHVKHELPLIQNWCNLYQLEYMGDLPQIEFNFREQQYVSNLWKRDKPIFLMHTNGGPLKHQPYPYSWARDMPQYIYQRMIDYFKDSHHIIQICRNESQIIDSKHVEAVTKDLSNKELFGLVALSDKRLLIDSSLQHAAAALNKPSVVLWIGTDPKVFGYSMHRNIKANLKDEDFKLIDSYIFDYNFNGALHECPLKTPTEMFNVDEIIDSFKPNTLG
jgi:hypothetical protein